MVPLPWGEVVVSGGVALVSGGMLGELGDVLGAFGDASGVVVVLGVLDGEFGVTVLDPGWSGEVLGVVLVAPGVLVVVPGVWVVPGV